MAYENECGAHLGMLKAMNLRILATGGWLLGMICYAQRPSHISGIVADVTGAGLHSAAVDVLAPVQLHAMTDNTGTFTPGPLDPGRYRLRVTERGFAAREMDVSVEPGRDT